MGRFSKTTQVKNNMGRDGFISAFKKVMDKRGFVPCAEDEAAKSYLLAFSDGWVTFTSESEDVPQVVKEMNVTSFSVEVVDSDFAILTLNNGDTVIFGDGSGYGIEDSPKGERKFWEPLLADGKTWEQFSEVRDKNEVFVEDALCEAAPILGIDTKYIIADYNELLDMAESDGNISAFYFKEKTADKKSKPMTLSAAFVKVFGEALEPLGFKKIKSKYPYFVRVVPGGEVLHIITYRTEHPDRMDEKSFNILGGVATVYVDDIDLTKNPLAGNIEWLECNAMLYRKTTEEYDEDFLGSIWKFSFKKDDENSMLRELRHSLDVTKRIILPMINGVNDLNSCIEYFYRTRKFCLEFPRDAEKMLDESNSFHECYLLVKADYRRDGLKRQTEKFIANTDRLMKEGRCGYTKEEFEKECEAYRNYATRQIAVRDMFLDNPKLKKKVLSILEQCRLANAIRLRSYGIEI